MVFAQGYNQVLAHGLIQRLDWGCIYFQAHSVVVGSTEFFAGCWPEPTLSSLPLGSLPHGSLHYQSMQNGRTIQRVIQQDVIIFSNVNMEVTPITFRLRRKSHSREEISQGHEHKEMEIIGGHVRSYLSQIPEADPGIGLILN